jgi:hypothetical protein
MVVTAAAVTAAGAIGSGLMTSGVLGGGSSGGSSSTKPNFNQVPQNPQDQAMKDYYDRLTVANTDKTYPAFGDYLESGGDPAKAKFDLTMPGMKPSEAAALGITGGRGESIPMVNPLTGAPDAPSASLNPAQTLYLAQERRRALAAQGQDPNKASWATKAVSTANTLDRVNQRLQGLQAITDPNKQQQRRIGKLTTRQGNLSSKQQDLFGGDPTPEG